MKLIYRGNYINGRFQIPSRGQSFLSENPGNLEEPIGEVITHARSVNEALEAAKNASASWANLPQGKRNTALKRFALELKKRLPELARLITLEMGKPLSESRGEIERICAKTKTLGTLDASILKAYPHNLDVGIQARCHYRPRGVCVVLSPFNVPAYLASAQILTALYFGNTVIHKPSELVPFLAQTMAEIWHKAGLPKGVYNLVQGRGEIGARLAQHPDVNAVFFTGSWHVGNQIRAGLLNQPQKMLALEMGGKNAAIVLNDCHVDHAARDAMIGMLLTSGQRCNATSRIIVESKVAHKFTQAFLSKIAAMRVGYGMDKGVFVGPLVSQAGVKRYLHALRQAPREGFSVVKPGGSYKHAFKGHYVTPSVHIREGAPRFSVREDNYTDNEIFGPNVAVYVVKNLEDAIALNNRPRYGLVTSVFTRSRKKYEAVLQCAQAGLVNWNLATVQSSGRLPFGGVKRSGNHRPAGAFTPYHCTIPTATLEKRIA